MTGRVEKRRSHGNETGLQDITGRRAGKVNRPFTRASGLVYRGCMPQDDTALDSVRHPAIQAFLEWAREAIGRDPSFRAQVDTALADLTIAPKLRHQLDDELDQIARESAAARS